MLDVELKAHSPAQGGACFQDGACSVSSFNLFTNPAPLKTKSHFIVFLILMYFSFRSLIFCLFFFSDILEF